MSLRPHGIPPVPEETARVVRAAFPHGSPYLTFRDALGTIFQDEDFAALFPAPGQPGLPPWRLALITIMQFREQLSDRQAAEAVRARIDWKYLLGLELSDPGFNYSVLSEFRDRLLAGSAEALLLDKLLERCRALVQVLMKKGPKLLDFAVAWRYPSLCFHRPERRILRWHAAANSPMSVSFHPWNAPSSSTGSAPRPSRRTGQAREDHFVARRWATPLGDRLPPGDGATDRPHMVVTLYQQAAPRAGRQTRSRPPACVFHPPWPSIWSRWPASDRISWADPFASGPAWDWPANWNTKASSSTFLPRRCAGSSRITN
jgi:transposase